MEKSHFVTFIQTFLLRLKKRAKTALLLLFLSLCVIEKESEKERTKPTFIDIQCCAQCHKFECQVQ